MKPMTYGVLFDEYRGTGSVIIRPEEYTKNTSPGWDGFSFDTANEAEGALFDTKWYWLATKYRRDYRESVGNHGDGSYDIWGRFSEATRRGVLKEIYTWSMVAPYSPQPRAREARIYSECPLGVAVRLEFPHLYRADEYACPVSTDIVNLMLASRRITSDDVSKVREEADLFIRDWDWGTIRDLSKAVKVER